MQFRNKVLKKNSFLKKDVASCFYYCDMKYIHYVEKPVVANKMIFEQEKKQTLNRISLKMPKNSHEK